MRLAYNMSNLIIDGYNLKIEDIVNITNDNLKVKLSRKSIIKIKKSREVVERIISNNMVLIRVLDLCLQ
jgi:histidine ammonia-lyase